MFPNVRESSAKERAKVKVHVEGGESANLAKKNPSQQPSALRCPEKGFRDASCMFKKAVKK